MTNIGKEKQCPYEILVEEVKERIRKLKDYGMSEKELTSLLKQTAFGGAVLNIKLFSGLFLCSFR